MLHSMRRAITSLHLPRAAICGLFGRRAVCKAWARGDRKKRASAASRKADCEKFAAESALGKQRALDRAGRVVPRLRRAASLLRARRVQRATAGGGARLGLPERLSDERPLRGGAVRELGERIFANGRVHRDRGEVAPEGVDRIETVRRTL